MKLLMRPSDPFKTCNISAQRPQNSLRIASLNLEKKTYFEKARQYRYKFLNSFLYQENDNSLMNRIKICFSNGSNMNFYARHECSRHFSPLNIFYPHFRSF